MKRLVFYCLNSTVQQVFNTQYNLYGWSSVCCSCPTLCFNSAHQFEFILVAGSFVAFGSIGITQKDHKIRVKTLQRCETKRKVVSLLHHHFLLSRLLDTTTTGHWVFSDCALPCYWCYMYTGRLEENSGICNSAINENGDAAHIEARGAVCVVWINNFTQDLYDFCICVLKLWRKFNKVKWFCKEKMVSFWFVENFWVQNDTF